MEKFLKFFAHYFNLVTLSCVGLIVYMLYVFSGENLLVTTAAAILTYIYFCRKFYK